MSEEFNFDNAIIRKDTLIPALQFIVKSNTDRFGQVNYDGIAIDVLKVLQRARELNEDKNNDQ